MNAFPKGRAAVATLVAALALSPAPAPAAESYDNCAGTIASLPATITTQGVWCLKGDLATAITSGAAITVAANNVTIDCNDFKLGGLAGGAGSTATGIRIDERMNAVVRRCNLRGFYRGIFADLGGGHVVEDNRLDGNLQIGILLASAGSVVRRNSISDTGGSTVGGVSGIGIGAGFGTDVIDNTISGITASTAGGIVLGISSTVNDGATISGNRVSGMAPINLSNGWGINDNSTRALIEGNYIIGFGVANTVGISCTDDTVSAARNTITGVSTAVLNCHSSGNIVNPN